MLIYLSINIFIVLLAMILYSNEEKYTNNRINKTFLCITGFIIIFISGFRGDFTSDYNNYINLFNYYDNFSFRELFQVKFGQEIGYVILNRAIGIFTNNGIYIILITAIITIVMFLNEFKKYSVNIWLSVLLFITIGGYYTSFNLIRQILAVAIIFSGSKYIYERKFIKYLIFILIASLFHKTSLIMIVFYFILNYRFNIKKLIIILASLLISMIYLDKIIFFIQKYFYSYYVEGRYGMNGFNYKNIILPLAILIFVLFHYYKLNFNNNKVNIWVNAIVFYTFFSLLGLKVQMVQRIADYFAPYALLIIPLIISEVRNKKLRAIYIFFVISAAIVYNYMFLHGSGYDPYFFIWEYR